ncbi:MAG: isopentenyl phosphate kinase [Candidatus Thalassarchaeaceae archaeon]
MDKKGRVLIKLGGGLITNKRKLKTLDKAAIDKVCKTIFEIKNEGYIPILVHGAGSYGHILAKDLDIAGGINKSRVEEQLMAVKEIRKNMLELNREIISSLKDNSIDAKGFAPSKWATGAGMDFSGDMTIFERGIDDPIPICFGDVVDRKDSFQFGILSGDDLMCRISIEIPNIDYSIFLLGDVGGVLDLPPNNKDARIMETWSNDDPIITYHETKIDVTGGINLKLNRASIISKFVEEVWFIDGRKPDRILELIRKGTTIGTKIIP